MHRVKFKFFILVCLNFFWFSNALSQFALHENNSYCIEKADSNKLFLHISNSNFLKNNEYFNRVEEGYTLMGYWLTPALDYHIDAKTCISGGLHMLHFSGRDKFFKTLPVLSITRQLTPSFILTLGTLQFNHNHCMPDPLLNPERFYFNQAESGLQFVFDNARIKNDTWISWDQFIYFGDSIQERLTFGNSSHILLAHNQTIKLKLPVYILFTHRGGQINRPKNSIETLTNIGSGLHFVVENMGSLRTLTVMPEFYYFIRNTQNLSKPFKKGWAFYPSAEASNGSFTIKAGWWYSSKFINPRGEPIYGSESMNEKNRFYNTRNIIISKLAYNVPFNKSLNLNCAFEGFYCTDEKLIDYNFSLHLNFNASYLIKTVKGVN